MSKTLALWKRLRRSAVLWSWIFNFLRLAAGLLLLPLLLTRLSDPDLGMYYVFLRLVALVPIIDFGFSVSIARNVSYAAAGAQEIRAQGLPSEVATGTPNYPLLWQLLKVSQRLYALMAIAAFLLLGGWGTWNVAASVAQTDHPTFTWIAWGVALLAATLELYLGWWNTFLRGANEVVAAARYAVLGYVVQVGIACTLLLNGGGLLSLPVGTLVGGLIQRTLSRRACLRLLPGPEPTPSTHQEWDLLKTLWPNSWRVGLQFLSQYVGTSVPGLLFATHFSLSLFAPYGVSMQIVMICAGMAMVWVQVKWPEVGQLRAKQDNPRMQQVLWPRYWLMNLTFLGLAAVAISIGPPLLKWLGTNKELLPTLWFSLLALTMLLELQFTFWGTLLSTGNRIPYLRAAMATQVAALLVFLGLMRVMEWQYASLIVGPLVAGCAYNYWHWPIAGARSIGTTLWTFIIKPPSHQPT